MISILPILFHIRCHVFIGNTSSPKKAEKPEAGLQVWKGWRRQIGPFKSQALRLGDRGPLKKQRRKGKADIAEQQRKWSRETLVWCSGAQSPAPAVPLNAT